MKKVLLIISCVISILLFTSSSQKSDGFINITYNQVVNGWAMEGNNCAGCSGFYYKIMRTEYPHVDGYYYYYIYGYSNSYYSNGIAAPTRINGLKIYVGGRHVKTKTYTILNVNISEFIELAKNTDPGESIDISYDNIEIVY